MARPSAGSSTTSMRSFGESPARLRRHRRGEPLSTTAMVDEVYRRLVVPNGTEPTDRVHFFALASRAMRNILVDSARARLERSRGGPQYPPRPGPGGGRRRPPT